MVAVKNIFICNPTKSRSKESVREIRRRVAGQLQEVYGNDINILDTFFDDFHGNSLQFLGKSISEGLALADIAVFVDDWEKYDGCRSLHFIATQYGVRCIYYCTWTA
jgi:hypothetical protein